MSGYYYRGDGYSSSTNPPTYPNGTFPSSTPTFPQTATSGYPAPPTQYASPEVSSLHAEIQSLRGALTTAEQAAARVPVLERQVERDSGEIQNLKREKSMLEYRLGQAERGDMEMRRRVDMTSQRLRDAEAETTRLVKVIEERDRQMAKETSKVIGVQKALDSESRGRVEAERALKMERQSSKVVKSLTHDLQLSKRMIEDLKKEKNRLVDHERDLQMKLSDMEADMTQICNTHIHKAEEAHRRQHAAQVDELVARHKKELREMKEKEERLLEDLTRSQSRISVLEDQLIEVYNAQGSPAGPLQSSEFTSQQNILLVHETTFAFPAALSKQLRWGSGITVSSPLRSRSSLDSVAKANLKTVEDKGGATVFSVNTVTGGSVGGLAGRVFDRIVLMLPNLALDIRAEGTKVFGLLLYPLPGLLVGREAAHWEGEIHLTLFEAQYDGWRVQDHTARLGLVMKEAFLFEPKAHPGFNPSENPPPRGEGSPVIFGIGPNIGGEN